MTSQLQLVGETGVLGKNHRLTPSLWLGGRNWEKGYKWGMGAGGVERGWGGGGGGGVEEEVCFSYYKH